MTLTRMVWILKMRPSRISTPRQAAACPRADAIVVLVGADYRAFGTCRNLDCWAPSAGALEATGLAVKEWLGYWIQAVRGFANGHW